MNALLNLLIKINITVLNIRFIRRRNINRIYIIHRIFAQLVKTLEDIARMVERGIYDLSTWIEGMKTLPSKKNKFRSVL